MEPGKEERERAVALAQIVEIAVAHDLSNGGGARLSENLDRHWNAFRHGLRGDPPARVGPLTVTFINQRQKWSRRERMYTHRSKPRG